MTQRDTFIDELFKIAKKDKDVILISVDMGASALDQWREELPEQFIWTGISEQHSINLAAGLSASGKKVYVYFMAAWSARCFEQIRYSCSMANNPITILSNGVALGYAPAGPAHETNEDIAYMRSLLNVEIHCPRNIPKTKELVKLSYKEPKLRYIRLERKYDVRFNDGDTGNLNSGIEMIKPGLFNNPKRKDRPKVAIVSYGYMLGRCDDVWRKMIDNDIESCLFDMYQLKPNPITDGIFNNFTHIVSVEEQTLSGGFGSIVLEGLSNIKVKKDVLRLGLPERYIFENGDRDYHLDNNGLSIDSIYDKIVEFIGE
jgi:transketolase